MGDDNQQERIPWTQATFTRSPSPLSLLQVLQALTQGDSSAGDGSELLGAALQVARDRVVVKRGKRLQPLVPLGVATHAQARPTYSVSGTTTRFDVYLTGAGPER